LITNVVANAYRLVNLDKRRIELEALLEQLDNNWSTADQVFRTCGLDRKTKAYYVDRMLREELAHHKKVIKDITS